MISGQSHDYHITVSRGGGHPLSPGDSDDKDCGHESFHNAKAVVGDIDYGLSS